MLERTDKIAINVSVSLLFEAAGTLHAVLIVIFMMHRIIGINNDVLHSYSSVTWSSPIVNAHGNIMRFTRFESACPVSHFISLCCYSASNYPFFPLLVYYQEYLRQSGQVWILQEDLRRYRIYKICRNAFSRHINPPQTPPMQVSRKLNTRLRYQFV